MEAVRLLAFEPQQHGFVAAMAAAGGHAGAVQLALDAHGAVEQAGVAQRHREQARRAHRLRHVRAAQPDAGLEQVKGAGGHGLWVDEA